MGQPERGAQSNEHRAAGRHERERQPGYRHDPHGHSDVDKDVKREHRCDAHSHEECKSTSRTHRDNHQAEQQDTEQRDHDHASDETELLSNRREDEVARLDRHELQVGLGTFEETLSEEAAGSDRDLGLDLIVRSVERVRLGVDERCEPPDLVILDEFQLEEADRLINPEKEAAAQAEATATGLRDNLESDKQKRQDLTTELASLPQLIDRVTQVEAKRQEFSGQQKQAQESLGSVKAKLQRCAEQETKKKEKTGLLSRIAKEENIYRELTKAFGKGGIQALIIEMALPEIEVEANRLLGRMTDNRMHLKFETQRASKKGDVIETLDINISDELGMRNYEMFSGGEAFRINFAIRIALSKLLAHRTGAALPTLIIDEGFGTQDANGIEKLKEAINSIQDDFKKLLVITHIEELRDAFPTRIDITKTADGSTLSVS